MKDLFKTSVVTIIAFVMICTSICFATPTSEKVTGEHIWFGVLKVPNAEFRMVIEVLQKADGTFAAVLTSLDQTDIGHPADEFSLENGTARFVLNAAGVVIEGPINGEDLTINAQFKQGQESLPLVLKTVKELPTTPKKQDPLKPYPYIEEAVVFDNPEGGVKLSGTLTIPRSQGPYPAVLLVGGSGPMERNEKAFGHKPFLVLSDYLTRNGFAVLHYDKRGVSRSTGDYHTATTTDFASDALAGFRYLRSRPDINPGAVGIIGHSEGAILAAMVASKSPDVAYIVMLGGPGINHCDGIILQNCAIARSKGMSEADIKILHSWTERYHTILKNEKNDVVAAEKLHSMFAAKTEDEKRVHKSDESVIDHDLKPWFREFIAGDPQPILRKVTCPVLALTGSKDVQVTPKENLKGIEESLKAGGNTRYTVKEMPNLNHLLQTADTGSTEEYKEIEETMAPIAQDTIIQWLIAQTGRSVQPK